MRKILLGLKRERGEKKNEKKTKKHHDLIHVRWCVCVLQTNFIFSFLKFLFPTPILCLWVSCTLAVYVFDDKCQIYSPCWSVSVNQSAPVLFVEQIWELMTNPIFFYCSLKYPQCIINLFSDFGFSDFNDSKRHTIVFNWSNREREKERISKFVANFFPVSLP